MLLHALTTPGVKAGPLWAASHIGHLAAAPPLPHPTPPHPHRLRLRLQVKWRS
jgi:hypothetical protein